MERGTEIIVGGAHDQGGHMTRGRGRGTPLCGRPWTMAGEEVYN